jgi:hypothetical protein
VIDVAERVVYTIVETELMDRGHSARQRDDRAADRAML